MINKKVMYLTKKENEYTAKRVGNDLGLDSFSVDQRFNGKLILGKGIEKKSGLLKQCIAFYDDNDKLQHSLCLDKNE